MILVGGIGINPDGIAEAGISVSIRYSESQGWLYHESAREPFWSRLWIRVDWAVDVEICDVMTCMKNVEKKSSRVEYEYFCWPRSVLPLH